MVVYHSNNHIIMTIAVIVTVIHALYVEWETCNKINTTYSMLPRLSSELRNVVQVVDVCRCKTSCTSILLLLNPSSCSREIRRR